VGSLLGDDIRALEDLDLLPEDTDIGASPRGNAALEGNPDKPVAMTSDNATRVERHGTSGKLSWFEEMISGSALGRTQKTRRGMGMSADGTTKVEWEVTEIGAGDDDSDSGTGRGKRKIGDIGGHDDVMQE
jgi:hypothetical protein